MRWGYPECPYPPGLVRARDEAFGACGGVTNLFMESFPNRPALVGGILGEDCRRVLADFCRAPGAEKKIDPQI